MRDSSLSQIRTPVSRTWRARVIGALTAAVVVLNASTPAHASGIPTVDVANIAQDAMQFLQTLDQYAQQLNALKSQLETQKMQLESITGSRGLGNILTNPAIRASISSEAQDILRASESGLGNLSGRVSGIEKEEALTGNYQVDHQNLADRANRLAVRSKALMEQTQAGMTARTQQVDQLQAQINQTEDPKAIADLQARLQVEQANIQVDQTRADMMTRQLQAEQALVKQQAEKLAENSFSIDAIRAPLPGAQ